MPLEVDAAATSVDFERTAATVVVAALEVKTLSALSKTEVSVGIEIHFCDGVSDCCWEASLPNSEHNISTVTTGEWADPCTKVIQYLES